MFITKVKINNFRCLKHITLDLNNENSQKLALLIGRNNSGKTSFITLFERFYERKSISFYDFPLEYHAKLLKFDKNTDVNEFLVQLILEIKYTDDDSLENISDFILDLDPKIDTVKILFEYKINKEKLNKALEKITDKHKEKFIQKNISDYINSQIYSFADDEDIKPENKKIKTVEKNINDIKKLINIQVIHAKRNVASSETEYKGKGPLSELTTAFYNQQNDNNDDTLNTINESIYDMDAKLKKNYESFFSEFLEQAQKFLNLKNLSVVSDLESKEIIANYSKIIYGDIDCYLPENLNGLGHLNIIYLLLQIEIKKKLFETSPKDINLLFIEEPEAHTHPQMQYVFMKEIKQVIAKIPKLQTFISTHSSHIVSLCDFKDIRYFKYSGSNHAEIKNFHHEMQEKYTISEHFKFLKQYLTLYSSELFFADKIIFIEGVTERILLPLFIEQFDKKNKKDTNYNAIRNQNISIVEVGNNAKVFEHFLEFLDIKTLIITDIDTTKGANDNKCSVNEAENIRNSTLKCFFNAPARPPSKERKNENGKLAEQEFQTWLQKLIAHTHKLSAENIKLAYQEKEHSTSYQARTFEDAFIAVNIEKIKENIDELQGFIKNVKKILDIPTNDYFMLAEKIIDSKSAFASSLLYVALTKNIEWVIPKYIETGLEWIQK